MTIGQIQEEVFEWSKRNFGNQPSWRPLLGAVEEVGELAHAYLKQSQGIRVNEDHRAAMVDAVADTVIFLMDFCAREGIDIQDAVEQTWAVVKQRDWTAHKAKGVGDGKDS